MLNVVIIDDKHATAINPEEACLSRSMQVYEFIRRSETMDLIELIKKENTGIFGNYPVAPAVETTETTIALPVIVNVVVAQDVKS